MIHKLEKPAHLAELLCLPNGCVEHFHYILSKKNLSFYANSIRVREVWIGNLIRNVSEDMLRRELSVFGIVDQVDLFFREQTFAFIKFQSADKASNCVDSYHLLNGRLGQIKVNYSDFLKRYNIVADRPSNNSNDSEFTNIVFVGSVAGRCGVGCPSQR